jgi:type IV fimbrial biogenesis protein FimT
VTLCATQDFSSCSSDWNHGFIGFLDANRNKRRDITETILYSNPVQPKYGSLAWRGTLNINSLTFQGDTGLPRGSNGSFYYCSSRSNHHLQIILSNMGHVRTQEISSC